MTPWRLVNSRHSELHAWASWDASPVVLRAQHDVFLVDDHFLQARDTRETSGTPRQM
jgi:hypothetical protein